MKKVKSIRVYEDKEKKLIEAFGSLQSAFDQLINIYEQLDLCEHNNIKPCKQCLINEVKRLKSERI